MFKFIQVLGVGTILTFSPTSVSPAIEVLDWNLGTAVELPSGGTAADGSNTPINPYIETEMAVLGISSASTSRSYAWSNSEAQILATASLAAAGSGGSPAMLAAGSAGTIFITSSSDLQLTIDASFSHALGPGDREAVLEVFVGKLNPMPPPPGTTLFQSVQFALPIIGHPPSGTFVLQHEMLLPAGDTYVFGYLMELRSFGGSATVLSYGNGHANFSLVVPEPASAALIVAAMPMALRRRRRD